MFCRFWAIWRTHRQRQLGSSTGVFYPFIAVIMHIHEFKFFSVLINVTWTEMNTSKFLNETV